MLNLYDVVKLKKARLDIGVTTQHSGTKWVELTSEKELQETYPQLPAPLPTLEQHTAATEAAIRH